MIDVDALLQPISDAAPAGEDFSFSAEFGAIQEARRSDDASLEQGDWVTELKVADWQEVVRLATDLLQTKTKDMRVAAWLTEACIHTDGFAGFACGYRVIAGLCDNFWETLYPLAEDGDQELRVGNLSWLLAQTVEWVKQIPLTNAPKARFTAFDVEMAARGVVSESAPDAAKIDAARAATPFDFYRKLSGQLLEAQEAFQLFEQAVDRRLGMEGPSFGSTREALDDVVAIAQRMASSSGVVEGDEVIAPTQEPVAGETTVAQPQVRGPVANRQEALMRLQEVADFFRRTEPHSPVAYLAERAARWGNMPLHVWLKQVLKDDATLGNLEELLGVTPAEDNSF